MPTNQEQTLTRPHLEVWPRDAWQSGAGGFRRFEKTVVLGEGDALWDRAAADVLLWRVKTRSGFEVHPAHIPTAVGARQTIVAGWGGVRILEPVEVVATCTRAHDVDHNLSALLRYESGLIASLHCGFNAHGRMHSDIVGSEGSLLVPDTFLDDAGQILLNTRAGSQAIAVPASDRYAAEVHDFSAAILGGHAPALSLDESLRNLRVLDRIRAALHG